MACLPSFRNACLSRLFPFSLQCSVECGPGTQQREVICVRKNADAFEVLEPYACAFLERPLSRQPCHLKPCGATWFSTEWSMVSWQCACLSSPACTPQVTNSWGKQQAQQLRYLGVLCRSAWVQVRLPADGCPGRGRGWPKCLGPWTPQCGRPGRSPRLLVSTQPTIPAVGV